MKKLLTIYIGLILQFLPLSLFAAQFAVELSAFSYSDIASIDQILDELEGPELSRGEVGFSHSQLSLSAAKGSFEVGAFRRLDYFFETNPDTAQLIWLNNNDIPADQLNNYSVKLDVNHILASGFWLGFRLQPATGMKLATRLKYLSSSEFTDGSIVGALETNLNDYRGSLFLDYQYSEDSLLDRPKQSVSGQGYALDLEFRWQVSERWLFEASLSDFASKINWDDVTYTAARATSNTVQFNPDGTLNSFPVLSGIESNRDHIQRLPVRSELKAQYSLNSRYDVVASRRGYDKYDFYQVGVQRNFAWGRVESTYDFTTEAIAFKVLRQSWYVELGADALKWGDMRAIDLQVGWYLGGNR